MPRARLPHLRHEQNRHGDWCWYFRKGDGKRIRLRATFGTPAFTAEYEAAMRGEKPAKTGPASGTLAWLVARYKESAAFSSLKPSTRRVRDNILGSMLKNAGDVPFVRIQRKHIQKSMDDRRATPHAANNFLIVARQMFAWAVANDHIQVNPCDGVSMIRAKTDGFHTWTLDEVDQYRECHPVGTTARLALDLLLFLGLRRSDVVRIGRQHVRDGVLTVKTEKTGTTVHVPIFPELQRSIDATKTGDLAFLISETGRPFASGGSFANWFRTRCDEAGLPARCTSHGLRKAGATIAANAGASAHALMAMYGWSRISMAEIYTKDADRIRLARDAAGRIANANPPHRNKSAAGKSKR